MSVQVGKPAPDIKVEAYVRGEEQPRKTSIADYHGKWVVLFFYPRDFTFVCPTEIQSFASRSADFEKEKAIVIGASTDSYHSHKAWFETDERLKDVNYPVIADGSHKFTDAFNILLEDGRALRGTFIIDPDGIVRNIQVNDLDTGRSIDETLRTLRAMRTGGLCPAGWQPGEHTLGEGERKEIITSA